MKRLISVLLCLLLFSTAVPAAFAQETVPEPEVTADEPEEMRLIDDSELESIIFDYLDSNNIKRDNVSIGFCYTGTGDEWFLNGDEWIYPASLYKVPLMMLLSEKVKAGELTQDSNIGGLSVGQIEEYVIVYSNNDWAHTIRAYLGGDETWRTEAKKYSELSDSDYSADYMTYCYFSARYITDVIETLYAEPTSFPNILECMGQAKPGEYLRTNLEGQFTIAQKYGSYIEPNGTWNNHAAGVIYTPNPIVVSIMTKNVDNYNAVIGKLAEMLTQYALTLDSRLELFRQQKLAAQVAAERAAEEKAAAEQRAAEEAKKAAEEKAAADKAAAEAAEKAELKEKRQAAVKKVAKLGLGALALAVLSAVGVVILSRSAKNRSGKSAHTGVKKPDAYYDEHWEEQSFEEQFRTEPIQNVRPRSELELPVEPQSRSVRREAPEGRQPQGIPSRGENPYSGAQSKAGRDITPAYNSSLFSDETFSEADFDEDDGYRPGRSWNDIEQERDFAFRRPATPAKPEPKAENAYYDRRRRVEDRDDFIERQSARQSPGTKRRPVSGTRKRGKHEL